MSNIAVRKANGDLLEVTLLTLFGMLAPGCRPTDVLSCLNRQGQVQVELRDGRADVWRAADQPQARALTTQPALPLSDFTAQAQLHFALPARIHCRGGSPSEVAHLIQEAVNGSVGVPPGFAIEVSPEDVQVLLTNLEIGSMSSIESITVHRVDQQRLITRSSLT
jgi:hypothetical protein